MKQIMAITPPLIEFKHLWQIGFENSWQYVLEHTFSSGLFVSLAKYSILYQDQVTIGLYNFTVCVTFHFCVEVCFVFLG